jgi:hypothetical protein
MRIFCEALSVLLEEEDMSWRVLNNGPDTGLPRIPSLFLYPRDQLAPPWHTAHLSPAPDLSHLVSLPAPSCKGRQWLNVYSTDQNTPRIVS